jgi:tagatose-6-phosphate ketose/aldose isomerase
MGTDTHPTQSTIPPVADRLPDPDGRPGGFAAFLAAANDGSAAGLGHTIREICQQPDTWAGTARHLGAFRDLIAASLAGCRRVVLTGSGSSQYAGDCAGPALQSDLRRPVEVIGGGELLLRRTASVAGEATLVVSLARSGDSPESVAVVETLLETEPHTRHLVITCNAQGRLARDFAANPRVRVVLLDPKVNDRSLVMTSSFTNLVLGARYLGRLDRATEFAAAADGLAGAGRQIIGSWADCLGTFVGGDVKRIVFLGNGGRYGATREASLKLLEMTAGKVATMAQTYLGLRHGPMAFIDARTLVVCFLSSNPLLRSYERDLILELNAKRLGARKLIAGVGDPGAGLCQGQDLAIPYEVPRHTADDDLALLDVLIGQILGFYRCLKEGLKPDSPSESGVISRVVGKFRIHNPKE